MTTYDEISPLLRSFFGVWEGLRKLGFASEDLFLTVSGNPSKPGVPFCFCALHTQDKSFTVCCGQIDDESEFVAEYVRVAEEINNGGVSQDDLKRIWQESEVHQHPTDFSAALLLKGLKIPKMAS